MELFAYLISSAANFLTSMWSTNAANAGNIKQTELSYDRQMDMLKYQNMYNSPVRQMARLKRAGLNPSLIYGGSNVSGNLTGGMPKYEPAKIEKMDFQMDSLGAAQAIKSHQDVKVAKAYEEKLYQDIENQKIVAANELIEGQIKSFEAIKSKAGAKWAEELNKYQAEIMKRNAENSKAMLDKIYAETEGVRARTALTNEEKFNKKFVRAKFLAEIANLGIKADQERIILRNLEKGIPPNSPYYVHAIGNIIEEMGFNGWKDFFSSFSYDLN